MTDTLVGITTEQHRAEVALLLERYAALNHLSAAYFRTTATLGDHDGAHRLLSELVDALQRDAQPLLGPFASRTQFLNALDALQ